MCITIQCGFLNTQARKGHTIPTVYFLQVNTNHVFYLQSFFQATMNTFKPWGFHYLHITKKAFIFRNPYIILK